MVGKAIVRKDWFPEFRGKTFKSVRPRSDNGVRVPIVDIHFESGEHFVLAVREGVYFESCMINTMRRAQPVTEVLIYRDNGTWNVEIETLEFPMLFISAQVRDDNFEEFPFKLEQLA